MNVHVTLIIKCCFWPGLLTLVYGESSFSKVSTDSNELDLLTSHSDIKSNVDCATLCDKDRNPDCRGFQFKSQTNVCQLYRGTILTVNNTSSHFIYKMNVDCEKDEFELIERDGLQVCYRFVAEFESYANARSRCQSMDSHLLHIDDLREYDAVGKLNHSSVNPWIGANDIDNEGVWVSDKEGTPLNTSLWLWNPSEPNDSSNNEDCAELYIATGRLNDSWCNARKYFICEKALY